jgi:hypothetical protein
MFAVLLTKKQRSRISILPLQALPTSFNKSVKKKVALVTGVIHYRPKPLFLGSSGEI